MRAETRDCSSNVTAYALLLLLWTSGCAGMAVPETPSTQIPSTQLEVPSRESQLQVLITYNGAISTHAAVRLEYPGRGTLFWDPAGLFGQDGIDETPSLGVNGVTRNNDLIWEHAPTLLTYWRFAEATGDTAMEVLEWRLSNSQVERLYEALVAGAQPDGFKGFSTDATEPFCAMAVSDFFRLHGRDIVQVSDTYLFPTSLAEQLRTQMPDRTVVLRTGGIALEYVMERRISRLDSSISR